MVKLTRTIFILNHTANKQWHGELMT